MRLFKKFLIMLVCSASFLNATAEDNKTDNTPVPDLRTVVLKPVKVPSNRPNTPSRVFIECVYGEGYMEFILPEGIDSIQVTITNEDFEWVDFATIDNPVILLPALTGVYDIICTTPDGREFAGEICF